MAKGKGHKRYEFGCKVAVVTTSVSNWIVGIEAHPGNPYDGATLGAALKQVERLTDVSVQKVVVDRGFRGSEYHPAEVQVHIAKRV